MPIIKTIHSHLITIPLVHITLPKPYIMDGIASIIIESIIIESMNIHGISIAAVSKRGFPFNVKVTVIAT